MFLLCLNIFVELRFLYLLIESEYAQFRSRQDRDEKSIDAVRKLLKRQLQKTLIVTVHRIIFENIFVVKSERS